MALRTFYQTLLDSDPARLRIIARQWEVSLTSDRPTDMAAELVDAIANAERVERMLERLPEAQRRALNDLLRYGGAMPWPIFTRRWGEVRAVGAGRVEREALWRSPQSASEGLWYLGLVQRAFDDRDDLQVEVAFTPEELRLYLPDPPPQPIPEPQPTDPPTYHQSEEDRLADDLTILWAECQNARGEADQARWSNLGSSASTRFALLRILSLEAGWLREEAPARLRPVADSVLAWLRADPWDQWVTLIRAWLESRRWNDLQAVPTLNPDPVKGWPNRPARGRRALWDVLKRCAPDRWYTLDAFTAYVKDHATDFLRPDGDYDAWGLRDAQTDMPLRGFDAWEAVEGAYLRFLITCPMHWLGLIDLGGETSDMVTAFSLSQAGAALHDMADPPSLPEPEPIQVSVDGTIFVPRRRRYERFQLSRVAEVLNWHQGRYRLTPQSLARAQARRIQATRIVEFLEEAGAEPVPQALRQAIRRAVREEETANLSQGWILTVPDPDLLESPELQPLITTRLNEGAALIRERDRDRVLHILAEKGYLARVRQSSS
jgi:hypothetical protein